MKAEIIAVGTEIILGQIENTNARYLSVRLAEMGIDVYWHTAVGDNYTRLTDTIRQALSRSDLLVLCGGLGPTMDDLTREAVAGVLGLPLEADSDWESRLEGFFNKLGRQMPENNRRQALVPKGAQIIPNGHGTAPGLWLEHEGRFIVLLPGPPRELEPMFENKVIPLLREKGGRLVIFSRVLKVAGLGESAMEEAIADLVNKQTNPTIAPLAKHTEVHLRLTAKAATKEEALSVIAGLEQEIRGRLGVAVYGADDETMAGSVATLLGAEGLSLAVAESCTGGLISHLLTNVPGISANYLAGAVTYSDSSKQEMLGVRASTLREYGAVSEETARSMAENARRRFGSDLGLAVTGIAGPGGATAQKPVGLVYISLAGPDGVNCRRFNFWGERETIKERAAATALNMLRLYLSRING